MTARAFVSPSPAPCLPDAAVVDRLYEQLAAGLSAGAQLRRHEPLAPRTTLRVGGPADLYLEPDSESDLALALRAARELEVPWHVLGRGSNLLIRDGGVRGLVFCLTRPAFGTVAVCGESIQAGAGARLNAVALAARQHHLAGLEFLEGIPGNVGGALRMNAGAMGSATFEVVERVRFIEADGEVREALAPELAAQYRDCPFLHNRIALVGTFRGRPDDAAAIRERMEIYARRRWASQPPQSSAGCLFKNPPGEAAGRLIDQLGLKGARVGAATISLVHGNFLVNEGGATARDVLALMESVRAKVREQAGIELETEVEIWGED